MNVSLSYYCAGRVTAALSDKNGRTIESVEGKNITFEWPRREIETVKIYPSYAGIKMGRETEITEHRAMEPVFYITDDPKILEQMPEYLKLR